MASGPQQSDARHGAPRDPLDDCTAAMAERRRVFVRERTGADLAHVGRFSIGPPTLQGNIENFIGAAQIPIGLAGPLRIRGEHANGDFYVPLATTEGRQVMTRRRAVPTAIARHPGAGVSITLPTDRSPEQAGAVFEILDELCERVWARYSLRIQRVLGEQRRTAAITAAHGIDDAVWTAPCASHGVAEASQHPPFFSFFTDAAASLAVSAAAPTAADAALPAAVAATEAALPTALAASTDSVTAAEAASATGVGAGAGAGAGADIGAGAGAGGSSFLPHAARATAAITEVTRSNLFIM